MIGKVLSVFIVGFWAVMTGLLARSIFSPDAGALAPPPEELILRFINGEDFIDSDGIYDVNQAINLQIFRENNQIGDGFLRLRPTDEPGITNIVIMGNVKGGLSDALPILPAGAAAGGEGTGGDGVSQSLAVRRADGELRLGVNDAGAIRGGALRMTIPDTETELTVEVGREEGAEPTYAVSQAGVTILNSAMMAGGGASNPMLGMMGIDPPLLMAGAEEQAGALEGIAGEGGGFGTISSSVGKLKFGGRDRRVHILHLELMAGLGVDFYFTEPGEFLKAVVMDEVEVRSLKMAGDV